MSARKTVSVGEMTNLITNNASTLEDSPFYMFSLISAPLQIVISTYMLWQYLGVATLAGLASMLVFIPLNTVFARLTKKITRKKFEHQDKRLKMMNEIFNGIRVRLTKQVILLLQQTSNLSLIKIGGEIIRMGTLVQKDNHRHTKERAPESRQIVHYQHALNVHLGLRSIRSRHGLVRHLFAY